MLYLWIFGDNVEDRFGHVKFIFFYVLCGLAATLPSWHSARDRTEFRLWDGGEWPVAGLETTSQSAEALQDARRRCRPGLRRVNE